MGFKVDTLALVMLGNPKALSICSAAQTLNRVSFFTNQFVLFHIVAKTGESGHRQAAIYRPPLPPPPPGSTEINKKLLLKEWHRFWCFRFLQLQSVHLFSRTNSSCSILWQKQVKVDTDGPLEAAHSTPQPMPGSTEINKKLLLKEWNRFLCFRFPPFQSVFCSPKLHNLFDCIGLYNTRGTTSTKYTGSEAPIIHIMDGKNGWQMNVKHWIVSKPHTSWIHIIRCSQKLHNNFDFISLYNTRGTTSTKYTGSGPQLSI